MGQILEDMTKASSERIEKYQVNPDNVENEERSPRISSKLENEETGYSSSRAQLQTAYCSTRSRSKRRTIFPK